MIFEALNEFEKKVALRVLDIMREEGEFLGYTLEKGESWERLKINLKDGTTMPMLFPKRIKGDTLGLAERLRETVKEKTAIHKKWSAVKKKAETC